LKEFGEYMAQFSLLKDGDATKVQKRVVLKKAQNVFLMSLPPNTPISGFVSPDLWPKVASARAFSFVKVAKLLDSLFDESKIKAERTELICVLKDADRFLQEARDTFSPFPEFHGKMKDLNMQHVTILQIRSVRYFDEERKQLGMRDLKKACDILLLIPNRNGWGDREVTLIYSKKLIDDDQYQEVITLLEEAYNRRCQESVSELIEKEEYLLSPIETYQNISPDLISHYRPFHFSFSISSIICLSAFLFPPGSFRLSPSALQCAACAGVRCSQTP
jgi:hypothetical protein